MKTNSSQSIANINCYVYYVWFIPGPEKNEDVRETAAAVVVVVCFGAFLSFDPSDDYLNSSKTSVPFESTLSYSLRPSSISMGSEAALEI